jgi:hypothetical protein
LFEHVWQINGPFSTRVVVHTRQSDRRIPDYRGSVHFIVKRRGGYPPFCLILVSIVSMYYLLLLISAFSFSCGVVHI